LSKPIGLRDLDRLVRKAHETGLLQRRPSLKAVLKQQQRSPQIVGESAAM
jgi:DNA-binding NtrC family response regulator